LKYNSSMKKNTPLIWQINHFYKDMNFDSNYTISDTWIQFQELLIPVGSYFQMLLNGFVNIFIGKFLETSLAKCIDNFQGRNQKPSQSRGQTLSACWHPAPIQHPDANALDKRQL
jgi:hypothetical protein